jgi:hypothetical protein
MTPEQLKLSISLTIKSLIDSSLTLNFRSHFVVTLYRIFEDYKRTSTDIVEQSSEILEVLTLFCKDLDAMFQILVDELSTIKGEVATLKKGPRVKFMNDAEQKNAEIRDLLISDGGAPFVDLSKEKTYPPDKFDLKKAE